MSKIPITIDQILDLLTNNSLQITELVADLSSDQLYTPSGQDEWSINDILAHLRSCADMWGNAIESILSQDCPTIKAVNPRTWIKQTNYPIKDYNT